MTKSIYINDDLEAIRAHTRDYVENEIVPRAAAWETSGVPRDVLDEMAKLGFFGLRVPGEHGGIGLGALASVVFAEELGVTSRRRDGCRQWSGVSCSPRLR